MMEIISKSKFYKVEYMYDLIILNTLFIFGSVFPYVVDAFLVWFCYLEQHLSLYLWVHCMFALLASADISTLVTLKCQI